MPLPVADVVDITLITLQVTLAATLLGAVVGVPLGAWLALRRDVARSVVTTIVHALYALPPVVAGLVLYLLLSAEGPLGGLGLLFTPTAIVLAETCLTTPLIAGLTFAAVQEVPHEVREVVEAAGARPAHAALALVTESRGGVLAGVLVGFGRALAEVAAALMVGGNVRGHTRTLGTAILQEVGQGDYGLALGLAAVLLGLAVITVVAIRLLDKGVRR